MATKKSQIVLDDMLDVAANTIKTVTDMPIPRSVIEQITKSVTSIGANFSEAQDASSKKDFISKIYIAKKEANETIYWFKLISRLTDQHENIQDLQHKTQGLLMMLQKIINSSRS